MRLRRRRSRRLLRRNEANAPRRRRRVRRTRRNIWKDDVRGHRRAARKGWRRRRRRSVSRRRARLAALGVPRRRRRRSRRARRNTWFGQSRRHARASRKGWRRRRRARRNPPRRSYRRRSYRLKRNPLEAVTQTFSEAFSGETLETIAEAGIGLGANLFVTKQLIDNVLPSAIGASNIGRVGTSVGVSILNSTLAGMVTNRVIASRVLVGGLLGSFLQLLGEVAKEVPAIKAYIPTVGLGQDTEFKRAVEQEVLRELRGGMGYIPPAGVAYLPAAGTSAYLTAQEARRTAGVGAYLTRLEAGRAVGMGYDPDPIGSKAELAERF